MKRTWTKVCKYTIFLIKFLIHINNNKIDSLRTKVNDSFRGKTSQAIREKMNALQADATSHAISAHIMISEIKKFRSNGPGSFFLCFVLLFIQLKVLIEILIDIV